MFDVLVFVYENFGQESTYPLRPQLGAKLSAAGFEPEAVEQALAWLDGLADPGTPIDAPGQNGLAASADSLRVYSVAEQEQLGAPSLSLLSFLSTSGLLPDVMRELVLERAMAVPEPPLSLDELRLIVLLVYWRCGLQLDRWLLDALCRPDAPGLRH